MGIRITNSLTTDQGSVTNYYLNIEHFSNSKKDCSEVQVGVNSFTDETKTQRCKVLEKTDVIKDAYAFDISETIETVHIKKALYDEIGAKLKAAGLSPESDETGGWVAY